MCIQGRFFPCKGLFSADDPKCGFQSEFIYYLRRYIKIILTTYKSLQSDKMYTLYQWNIFDAEIKIRNEISGYLNNVNIVQYNNTQ